MITTEQLDEWQAVCDKATPGPWVPGPAYVHAPPDRTGVPWCVCETGIHHDGNARFIASARTAMPELIAEVRGLREQLRAYQTSSLRRQMRDWSEDWYASGWESQLSRRIWKCEEWDEEDTARPSARAIVEFGRRIDAWITDDGKVVTIAEWEAMLAEIHKSEVRRLYCTHSEPLASGFCPDCEQTVNLLPVAEKSPDECSICRGRHGSEVRHACE